MMKKSKLTVRERILKLFDNNHVGGLDAKTIAKRTKSNYNSVRRELGYIMRNMGTLRSFYSGRIKHYAM